MRRYVLALSLAAATALGCINVSDSTSLLLVVSPVLDSVFVGDKLPARDVFTLDANGNRSSPGSVVWEIRPESVATVDATTGEVTAVSKGTALVIANALGVQSGAVVSVSRSLEMTLQLDTIVVMPGDTVTVPLAIKQKTPGATTLQFDASPTPSVYTIDAATGLVTAQGTGGPARYRVSLTDGTNTVSDSGAVVVMTLADTTATGRFFMTAFGTGIRHQSGGAYAVHYAKRNGKLAFQLVDTLTRNAAKETVLITLRDSILDAGTFRLDTISPGEANTPIVSLDPICNPPRSWAVWASVPSDPRFGGIVAYSHGTTSTDSAGYLSITQYAPVGGGAIISGRYLFRAQRFDLYGDPLGLETIRGTFVAPLRQRNLCTA
jgi:Big-like domain-containing protein